MKAEIIAVGTELLLGQIVNSNARFLSEKLAEAGIGVYWHTVVGDNPQRLADVFRIALERADIILFSGGLGPTMDDLTKETVAEVLRLPMEKDHAWEEALREMFRRFGRPMTANNLKQALMPAGALLIPNRNGTAPGVFLRHESKYIAMMPGPPREMEPMFMEDILPLLPSAGGRIILSRVLKLSGIGESAMEEAISDLVIQQTNPTIAPLAKQMEVHLRLTAAADTKDEAAALLDQTEARLLERLSEAVFARDEETMVDAVAKILTENNLTIAVAESCTGGLLAHWLTNYPGSSRYFLQGVAAYSNRSKLDLLGVNPQLLREYGAVSEPVALAMAENIRQKAGCDLAIAITGIAGPTGGSPEKPVGLVYIAIAAPGGIICERFNFRGNRENIKERAVMTALNLLRLYLIKQNR